MVWDLRKRNRRLAPAVVGLACLFSCLSSCLSSCQLFQYSPYEIPPAGNQGDRLAEMLFRLAATDGPGRSFSFAVIADIQSAYDELDKGVEKINADSSIRFVIVNGDLTQYGLLREFEWVKQGLDRLSAPYLSVIGNHDALANGAEIFHRMFAPLDYSFTYRGAKFVIFNDNVWQFDYPVPDLQWLEAELETGDSVRLLPVAHIPPWGDQIEPEMDTVLTEMFARHRVTLCIFAHQHNFHYHPADGLRSPYVLSDDVGGRNFVKITLGGDTTYTVQKVYF